VKVDNPNVGENLQDHLSKLPRFMPSVCTLVTPLTVKPQPRHQYSKSIRV
jgi:hypothetical protein